jgi:carbamoyl-phosphate synthase large subunit
MSPVILVTGVGGGVGQSIVKSLQDSRYRVIGADSESLATGLYAVEKAYRVPFASDPAYIERILEICVREKCALIFPGIDAELGVLSQESQRLKAAGVVPVVSSPEVIKICDNKLVTYQFLVAHGFHAPRTLPFTDNVIHELSYPMVLKPMKGGARSQGVFVVREEQEFLFRLATLDCRNYVVQEYIPGDEYTCGSVNVDGHCYGTIVMRRILRDGDTYKAFISSEPRIHAQVRAVVEALQPFGACNVQLRLRDEIPYIFEINARCSGTTYCRSLAGYNEPLMVADWLLFGKKPNYHIREISILRYWKEFVVENSRIEAIKAEGVLHGNGVNL